MKKSPDLGHGKLKELALVAERLNNIWRTDKSSDPLEQERYEAWRIIDEIVSSKSLAHAAERFTILAAAYPVRMEVFMGQATRTRKEEEPLPTLSLHIEEIGFALSQLWHAYFHAQGWTRLKRCQVCQTWFVDPTSDKRKERCSVACTNRWWSYNKRKKAEYSRFKKGGYHGTKGR